MIPLDIDRLRRAFPARTLHYRPTLKSTMTAAAGMPIGDVVLADEQTAGQGRHGHSWHSAAGDGIYCSLVLPQSPLLTLALGLAAHSAIFEATGLVCDLRWPNDLMLGDRKVAGILVQAVGRNAIAGIGINVNQAAFPDEVAAIATSLQFAAGRAIQREEILLALLPAIDAIVPQSKAAILKSFSELSSYATDKRVEVQLPEGVLKGTTAGLDPDGFLTVRRDDGTVTLVVAGGVRAAGS
ncbi:MAG TPA: biotin--[acetyl-CoA-carboxylase] ligase [Bryobacteraceae bacterium]|jgi:BirA family biotin operon repressor/biotin-[acetyl-CoA-carboxylase] ligase|nr:biotin--[acetyl-CoA-carboxylase] ligase [Bryobacteraceae bacterium]